jgi:hypothetical protein
MRTLNIVRFDKKKQNDSIEAAVIRREIDLIVEGLKLLDADCAVSIRQLCYQLVILKYDGTKRQKLVERVRFLGH